MTDNNNLTGYVGQTQLPQNPYDKGNEINPRFQYKQEYQQHQADVGMAQYNAQLHENELLMQRKWALEDRDYNSPAQLRARLEAAGYNPALMAGAVQTANAPVRASSANTPGGSMSNMAGYASAHNAAMGNIIDAGRSIVSTMLAGKQMQNLDADINLKNSQSIKTLTDSARTKQDTRFASELFGYQKNALELDIKNKKQDWDVKDQYYREVVPAQIKNLNSQTEVNQTKVKDLFSEIALRSKQSNLTEVQQRFVEQETVKLFNENSLFNKEREYRSRDYEAGMKQLDYELQAYNKKLQDHGVNPQSSGLFDSVKRTIVSIVK